MSEILQRSCAREKDWSRQSRPCCFTGGRAEVRSFVGCSTCLWRRDQRNGNLWEHDEAHRQCAVVPDEEHCRTVGWSTRSIRTVLRFRGRAAQALSPIPPGRGSVRVCYFSAAWIKIIFLSYHTIASFSELRHQSSILQQVDAALDESNQNTVGAVVAEIFKVSGWASCCIVPKELLWFWLRFCRRCV